VRVRIPLRAPPFPYGFQLLTAMLSLWLACGPGIIVVQKFRRSTEAADGSAAGDRVLFSLNPGAAVKRGRKTKDPSEKLGRVVPTRLNSQQFEMISRAAANHPGGVSGILREGGLALAEKLLRRQERSRAARP